MAWSDPSTPGRAALPARPPLYSPVNALANIDSAIVFGSTPQGREGDICQIATLPSFWKNSRIVAPSQEAPPSRRSLCGTGTDARCGPRPARPDLASTFP